MTAQVEKQEYSFQAEIKQLLHLLSHSLYQNREIAIRELVSNASDALDKYRYTAVNAGKTVEPGELRVWIEPDKDARVLVIRDNGIGMTREELVANLGTIARSGSLEFLKQAQQAREKSTDVSLIGQFGVGFYSSFMLADSVEVRTCSHTESSGWSWESTGDGNYVISELPEHSQRGTQIRLQLKEGLDEFTDPIRLKYVLRKYSTFVPHQIWLADEHINNQPPIWVEPKSSLSEEQYNNFYEYLTHFPGQKPLWHLHLAADSPFQFYSILYCPDVNLERMGFGKADHGLHLCAKRILVQNDNRDLLPDYLRFLRGIVDSADLPLNVSRESLQDNTVFRKMQKVITKKVLDHLDTVSTEDKERYTKFYQEFGAILREGVASDFDNRERVARLMRFASTRTGVDGEQVSLPEYVERMAEGQEQIYFLTGTDPKAILRDPNLEVFTKRNLEVLLLVDPVDEYMLGQLRSFDEKDIVSVDSAELKLPENAQQEEGSDDTEQKGDADQAADGPGFERLLELFSEALGERVREVRRSERLTSSACCLVNAEGTMSTTMQRVLRMNTPDFEMGKMILEVNPQSDFIRRLSAICVNPQNADFIRTCGLQLHSNAMITAGLAPDPNEMAARVQDFMLQLAGSRSAIATE